MTMEQLRELDERVFKEYISRKSESLVGIVEPGLQGGFFDWEQCGDPEEVRSYVKDILLNLMMVHAEVRAMAGSRYVHFQFYDLLWKLAVVDSYDACVCIALLWASILSQG